MLISWDGTAPKDPLLSASAPSNLGNVVSNDLQSIADDESAQIKADSIAPSVASERIDNAMEKNDYEYLEEGEEGGGESPSKPQQEAEQPSDDKGPALDDQSDDYSNDNEFLTTMGSNKYRIAQLEAKPEADPQTEPNATEEKETDEVIPPLKEDSVVENELDEKYDQEFDYSNDFASLSNTIVGKSSSMESADQPHNHREEILSIITTADEGGPAEGLEAATGKKDEADLMSPKYEDDYDDFAQEESSLNGPAESAKEAAIAAETAAAKGRDDKEQDEEEELFFREGEGQQDDENAVAVANNAPEDASYGSEHYEDDDYEMASPEGTMRPKGSRKYSAESLIEEVKKTSEIIGNDRQLESMEALLPKAPPVRSGSDISSERYVFESEGSDTDMKPLSNEEGIVTSSSLGDYNKENVNNNYEQDIDDAGSQGYSSICPSIIPDDTAKDINNIEADEVASLIELDSGEVASTTSLRNVHRQEDDDEQYLVDFDEDAQSANNNNNNNSNKETFHRSNILEDSTEDIHNEPQKPEADRDEGSIIAKEVNPIGFIGIGESPSRIEQIDFNVIGEHSNYSTYGTPGAPEKADTVKDNYINSG